MLAACSPAYSMSVLKRWSVDGHCLIIFQQLTLFIFLLLARYVPNVAKEELWDQCKKYEYWRPTDDRPQGPFTHFGKISNGHNSGSRVGFSGTADPTAPFPVGSNSRWRPAAILENFKRPCISRNNWRYIEEERKRPWETAEKTAREEYTLDWSQI